MGSSGELAGHGHALDPDISLTSRALRSAPAANSGLLLRHGFDSVLLEPLALGCFRIVVLPALEDLKFYQHRPVLLSVDGLGAVADVSEEVELDSVSAAHDTPNWLGSVGPLVARRACCVSKYEVVTVTFVIQLEVGLMTIPDLVDRISLHILNPIPGGL